MQISRRHFLTLLGASSAAAVTGFPSSAFALPVGATKVIWLMGSGCSGCSISFLNLISQTAPETVADVLLDIVEVDYHTSLMSASGDLAVQTAESVYAQGSYLLVVEGGVPTAFNGAACWAWTQNGVEYTFQDVVTKYAGKAAAIVCLGTCASWGGVASAYPNPTAVKGVKDVTGKTTINVAGCPPHPDWLVWVIATALSGGTITLDEYGRPAALFAKKVHDICPRKPYKIENIEFGMDGYCLKDLGCKGPRTKAACPTGKWNGGVNWCIDANAPCIGCTEPTFPLKDMTKITV